MHPKLIPLLEQLRAANKEIASLEKLRTAAAEEMLAIARRPLPREKASVLLTEQRATIDLTDGLLANAESNQESITAELYAAVRWSVNLWNYMVEASIKGVEEGTRNASLPAFNNNEALCRQWWEADGRLLNLPGVMMFRDAWIDWEPFLRQRPRWGPEQMAEQFIRHAYDYHEKVAKLFLAILKASQKTGERSEKKTPKDGSKAAK